MKRKLILFGVWGVMILSPWLADKSVFKQNDLPAKLVNEVYLKKAILEEGRWPQWNPLLNQGIPMAADPLSDYFNPLMGAPMLFLSREAAIKIIYVVCVVLAGTAMYLLAREAGISKWTAALGMTYEAGGYLAARITAGHAEKVLTYPLLPFFLLFLWRGWSRGGKWAGAAGLIWALMLFSGDVYNWWYAGLVLGATGGYVVVTDRGKWKRVAAAAGWGLALGAVKWWPMLLTGPYLVKIREPFAGSQNIVSMVYHLFLPLSGWFKRTGWWQMVPSNFGWWEKAGFIGPVWLAAIWGKLKLRSKGWWLAAGTILVLAAMPAWILNPYHILVQKIDWVAGMHAPTRVWGMLGVVILVVAGKVYDGWRGKKRWVIGGLMLVNLAGVVSFFEYALIVKKFPEIQAEYEAKINNALSGSGIWQDAAGAQIPQDKAAERGLRILNSTYGVNLKGSAAARYWTGEADKPEEEEFPVSYWGVDEIRVSASGKDKNLTVGQSYFPGWRVWVDGKEAELDPGSFLQTKILPGEHEYVFRYFLPRFVAALGISWLACAALIKVLLKP